MKFPRFLLPLALLAAALAAPAQAEDSLTPAQQDQVRQIVRDYLMEHPEVLMESLRAYQARMEEEQRNQQQAALGTLRDEIERDGVSPVAGAPDGDVTVVEFMDYRCGYCKKVFPALRELIESDGNIRYVVKELPILGPDSVLASRAALAVWRTEPEKYMGFHTALMEARGGLTENKLMVIAADLGIEPDGLRTAMQAPEVEAIIQRNHELASKLGIGGTPAFIIGEHFIPGAVSAENLKALVAAAREG